MRARARALMGTRTPAAQRLLDCGYGRGPPILARALCLSGPALNPEKWNLQARSVRVWTLLSLGTVAQGRRDREFEKELGKQGWGDVED